MTAMASRPFELRKPSQARKMRGRLGAAVQRCPRDLQTVILKSLDSRHLTMDQTS